MSQNLSQPPHGRIQFSAKNLFRVAVGVPLFLLIVVSLIMLATVIVDFVHLSLVYGIEPVASGQIYFKSTKQELIVSNGDILYGQSGAYHIVLVSLWLGSFFGLAYRFRRFVGLFQLDRGDR